jgi:HK97 family phage prohead protease
MITRRIREKATTALAAKGQFEFLANTDEVGLDGLLLVSTGCEPNVDRSLPMLWGHDMMQPIGKVIELKIAAGSVRGVCQAPTPGISPIADQVIGLLREDIINSVSTGFEIIEAEDATIDGQRVTKVTRWRLAEVSVVSVGALPAAEVTARGRRGSARPAAVDAQRRLHARMAALFAAELGAPRGARRMPLSLAGHRAMAELYARELKHSGPSR